MGLNEQCSLKLSCRCTHCKERRKEYKMAKFWGWVLLIFAILLAATKTFMNFGIIN